MYYRNYLENELYVYVSIFIRIRLKFMHFSILVEYNYALVEVYNLLRSLLENYQRILVNFERVLFYHIVFLFAWCLGFNKSAILRYLLDRKLGCKFFLVSFRHSLIFPFPPAIKRFFSWIFRFFSSLVDNDKRNGKYKK